MVFFQVKSTGHLLMYVEQDGLQDLKVELFIDVHEVIVDTLGQGCQTQGHSGQHQQCGCPQRTR